MPPPHPLELAVVDPLELALVDESGGNFRTFLVDFWSFFEYVWQFSNIFGQFLVPGLIFTIMFCMLGPGVPNFSKVSAPFGVTF